MENELFAESRLLHRRCRLSTRMSTTCWRSDASFCHAARQHGNEVTSEHVGSEHGRMVLSRAGAVADRHLLLSSRCCFTSAERYVLRSLWYSRPWKHALCWVRQLFAPAS